MYLLFTMCQKMCYTVVFLGGPRWTHTISGVGGILNSVLQMEKRRHREVEWLPEVTKLGCTGELVTIEMAWLKPLSESPQCTVPSIKFPNRRCLHPKPYPSHPDLCFICPQQALFCYGANMMPFTCFWFSPTKHEMTEWSSSRNA